MSEPQLESDEAAIREVARKAMEAEVNEDLDTWLATITDDAVLVTANGPIAGKPALREFFAESFSTYDWDGHWTLESIEISGNLAVVWGPIETTLSPWDGGEASRRVGYHMDVLRRHPDGTWKFTWWMVQQNVAVG